MRSCFKPSVLCVLFVAWVAAAAPVDGQERFHRGVYIGYSDSILQVKLARPTIVQDVMRSLKANGVTHVWTTNGPDTLSTVTEFVTAAKANGIETTIGSGLWYAPSPGTAAEKYDRILSLWNALPKAARPDRFGLADEPAPSDLAQLSDLASRCKAAGISTAAVSVPYYFAQTAAAAGASLDYLGSDPYPFYAPNLPSGAPTGSRSLTYAINSYRDAVQGHARPLLFPQGFQQHSGPARQEADGSVTLLPGSRRFLLMPTKAEMTWQIYASACAGGKGAYVFAYGLGHVWIPNPAAPASDDPNHGPLITTETSTGGPATLVSFPQYQGGSQLQGMTEAYTALQRVETILPALVPEATLSVAMANAGDLAVTRRHLVTGKRYLCVVSDPQKPTRNLYLFIPNSVRTPINLTSQTASFHWFGHFFVTLPAGTGGVWELP